MERPRVANACQGSVLGDLGLLLIVVWSRAYNLLIRMLDDDPFWSARRNVLMWPRAQSQKGKQKQAKQACPTHGEGVVLNGVLATC